MAEARFKNPTKARSNRSHKDRLGTGKATDGTPINLYCIRQDGVKRTFWITRDRKRIHLWEGECSQDAAYAMFERLKLPEDLAEASVRQRTEYENWQSQAEAFLQAINPIGKEENHRGISRRASEYFEQHPLTYTLLATLHYRRLLQNGRTENHARTALTSARRLRTLGPIPNKTDDFREWAQRAAALAVVTAASSKSKSQDGQGVKRNAKKQAFEMFLACLEELNWTVAFKNWQTALNSTLGFLKKRVKEDTVDGEDSESRPPFTIAEIDSGLLACNALEEILACTIALSMGCRPGEISRYEYDHIVNSRYTLKNVVSKTSTKKRPEVPLALKAALRILKEEGLRTADLTDLMDRERFRATCATHLHLCGAPPLVIADRLGHSTFRMVQEHYGTQTPADFRSSDDLLHSYYKVPKLLVDGQHVEEPYGYDIFVLQRLLSASARINELDRVKKAVLQELRSESLDEKTGDNLLGGIVSF